MQAWWRTLLVLAVLSASVSTVPVIQAVARGSTVATWSSATTAPDDACEPADRSRFADCQLGSYWWNIRQGDPLTGPVIGTAQVSFTISERLPESGRQWSAHYTVYVVGLTGVATTGTTAAVVPECGGGCPAGNGAPDSGTPLVQGQTLSGDIGFVSPGTAVSNSTQTINVFLFHPAAAGTGSTQGDPRSVLGPVRCDSATPAEGLGGGRPGCVVPEVTPTLRLSDPQWGDKVATPAHDAFVLAAQNNPRTAGWGKPGAGKPLVRERLTPAEQRKKRYQVCGRFERSGSGDSCDEYPYSSTRQGIPAYAVTEHVPKVQNDYAGAKLSRFYTVNHVLDGDRFYVAP